ncbi:ABC transporter ATP-binding protein [Clostridium sp. 19966]|uniref:ABC transporter ATP-binding protein n=1 Tax=Clostridium sp. 19966 TaxID=2768166 RepID=UPI0028DED319|nr:ABC transporter ATP-binding protein [Clostridium sp. 19966]MDT8717584.1 ABC transporter ATP-binding protein [Clostridium sp. 19966]
MSFKLEKVNLIYDIGKEVQTYALKDINLTLEGNKLIGIMGPSGSGKSSLLYAMAGFKKPTSGKVFYNNSEYSSLNSSKKCDMRKQDFGFIFQRHFLIDYMTILDNILTPINDDSKEAKVKAMELLEKFKLGHLAKKRPNQLSGGQRQKVAIARALISDPKVIFADEPTAALDHKSAKEVMGFLESFKEDRMIIVVTHDPSILVNADSIINMADGALVSAESREG